MRSVVRRRVGGRLGGIGLGASMVTRSVVMLELAIHLRVSEGGKAKFMLGHS